MIDKEKILGKFKDYAYVAWNGGEDEMSNEEAAKECVEIAGEYAKEVAIDFAKFLVRLKVEPIAEDIWEVHGLAGTGGFPIMNLDQLFQLHLTSNK